MGFFTIEKLWHCKEYSEHAVSPQNSHWFDKFMMQVRTDSGLVYKMPFIPWLNIGTADEKKSLADLFDEDCVMREKKPRKK